jgi:hypothetical protein
LRTFVAVAAVIGTVSLLPAAASAAPVATSDPQYQAYGAVFPDPLAVCQQQCDPNSRGRTNATQFIQFQEFVDAITFMNQNADWKRYMEVLPLDGKKGEGGGTKAGDEMWPGNNLSKLEWSPKPEYQSAGLATSDRGRQKSDLIIIRVTDENVPDAGKKRYALSLSIHGIERAGAEGGIRAMEEMVTSVAEERGGDPILPKEVREGAPTWNQVLANTIVYFTLPNPDGWRRGSVGDTDKGPGIFYQRYNGNGIDPNRDWPDIGFSFRRYSGGSEPETRAFQTFYHQVEERGGQFAAGDDLHGQPFADALSYTLMPHGRHDIEKDYRIREASKLINRAQYHATKWSPYIIENDQQATACEDTLGATCDAIYAQTWGSVYDTINYTTTGSLGDWFDSSLGLGADGIDNEMSFSHLDRNIAFEPHGEQLHVAGNKAIIYSHIADMLRPPGTSYSVPVKSGYVANTRLTRERKQIQPAPPEGTTAQDDIDDQDPSTAGPEGSIFEFEVKQDKSTWNGGMRIDVRASNVQGVGSGIATLEIQCKFCDDHVGVEANEDWITVAEDFNQGIGYAQAGMTAAVNHPDARTGDKQVLWRAVVSADGGVPKFSVDFTSEPATSDGASEGDDPPFLAGYDVANTDFFKDLNEDAEADNDRFDAIDPAKVIAGEASLDSFRTIVLADEALPGYNGAYKGQLQPTGGKTADFEFPNDEPTTPGQTAADGCTPAATNAEATDEHPFTIPANDLNRSFTVTITWSQPTNDWALAVFRVEDGKRELVGSTDTNPPATSETLQIQLPRPGEYVIVAINCAAAAPVDPFTGTVEFEAEKPPPGSTFSAAQKDTWIGKLRDWVSGGGNLVLTDGALKAVSELTSVPGPAINERVVYVGQTSFQVCDEFSEDGTTCTTKETVEDPLSKNVVQLGARFNSGMRRQTFEPTPLGFAIQSEDGGDASFARQFDIKQQDWVAAGGRPVGGSANSGARDAEAVPERTTLGEMPLGQGKIRILGALLPQPSNEYDHPLGVEPYSVTYTGYILFCNLVDCKYEPRARPGLPNAPAPPGPVRLPFGAKVKSPLLASGPTRNGKRITLRVRGIKLKRIRHYVLQYRKTGRGTNRRYRTLRPRLSTRVKKVGFKKGRIGQTYLFRIRAVGKSGVKTGWDYSRTVYPYEDRGKGRRYSGGWTRIKNRRAWRGGYSQSSRRGATLNFITKGGGRVYLIGRTGPTGGRAVVAASGGKKRVVSFRSKRWRNRRVITVVNRTDKRALRFRVRVLRGTVMVDGIGVRRR